jgi:hypothetical protein
MTVESCAASCAGYTYFGVEYGRECEFALPLSFTGDLPDSIRLLW